MIVNSLQKMKVSNQRHMKRQPGNDLDKAKLPSNLSSLTEQYAAQDSDVSV
jgi:hypothetical protein